MKHKHYECIVAWAEGKQIQFKYENNDWEDLISDFPKWYFRYEYRIKPEPPKEEEPKYLYVYRHIDTREKLMSTTLMQAPPDWDYMGKVRLEK
jgi:hypothetical protein